MTFSANKSGLAVVVLGGLGLAYPFAVYFSLGRVPAGALVVAAVALVAARLRLLRRGAASRALTPALAVVMASTAGLGMADAHTAALAYPVLMSLGMAAAFGLSLLKSPCLVECFAALAEPAPSDAARSYMRRVTMVWALFLTVNAGVSAWTAASGDMALWTLYNGLISYVLMGALFAAEYAIRRRVRLREAAP
ncbi:MAG TPA: hypothetical protein VK196_10325 [Magnetospirillum sp.]|nr:hypothetical protein [Magnetospirillum sp.]